MKQKVAVDQVKLQEAINQAEANGPLSGRSVLWQAAADIYNKGNPAAPVTASVVYLRFVEMGLTCTTQLGRKGGSMSAEHKAKMQEALQTYRDSGVKVARKSRAEKMASNPQAEKHFARLREITPSTYQGLLAKVEAGSLTAAIKLNCLLCVGGERAEVRQCTGFSCPMFLHRPYQKTETEDDDVEEKAEGAE